VIVLGLSEVMHSPLNLFIDVWLLQFGLSLTVVPAKQGSTR